MVFGLASLSTAFPGVQNVTFSFSYMRSEMDNERLRELLRQELAYARAETDHLFQMLAPPALYDRPIPERHRVIFYLGHLEAFDWNMIAAKSFGLPAFN